MKLTRSVLRDALTWPGMAANVPYWRSQHATREDAELALAGRLAKLIPRHYRRCIEDPAVRRFVTLAFSHVNWRRVAARLLDEYAWEPKPVPSVN